MSRHEYARERSRVETDGLVERHFGPASPRSQRMAAAFRFTIHRTVSAWRPTSRGIKIARRAFDPGTTVPPIRGTRFQRRMIGGVPVEWSVALRAAEVDEHERVILYFHGGGFVMGSPRTHRNLVSRLSHVTATPVASVDYRMVPEASIQASRADALAVYKGLLESGYPPEAIVTVGDSAGGNLAAYVALASIEQGLPVPAAQILLSPWLDLTSGGPSRVTNAGTEFFLGGEVLSRIAHVLVPDHHERYDWHNSPLHAPAEMLRQLPPTLIQIGSAEVLADDGVSMARAIGEAGGRAELQTYDEQGHVVALWAGNPDARRALKEIALWLREVLDDDREPSAPTDEVIDEATEAAPADSPVDRARKTFPG